MKLISFGKIEKKFYILLILHIIINVIFVLYRLYFDKNPTEIVNNISLNNIITYFLSISFCIPEYMMRKKVLKEKGRNNENIFNKNKIIYLFRFQYNKIDIKNIIRLIIFLLLYYAFYFGYNIYRTIYSEHFKFANNFSNCIIDIVYLYLIYRFIYKTIFYKHQNLSMLILILTGLIRFFFRCFVIKRISFDFPNDLFSLIPLIIYPFFESIEYYLFELFMKYKYFSPLFISFTVGIINVITSFILLFIFLNIDCGNSKICILLTELPNISIYSILLYILQSILFSIMYFIIFKIIYDYSVFHVITYFSFADLLNNILMLILDYNNYELILIIFTFFFEIFWTFVFVEIIELNFCGLNTNLKKSIIFRSKIETDFLFIEKDDDNEDNNDDTSLYRELDGENDKNSVY